MSHELHYTSVPRGLKSGSVGFSTVAQTAGLPAPIADRLEGLSGYRPVYPPGSVWVAGVVAVRMGGGTCYRHCLSSTLNWRKLSMAQSGAQGPSPIFRPSCSF